MPSTGTFPETETVTATDGNEVALTSRIVTASVEAAPAVAGQDTRNIAMPHAMEAKALGMFTALPPDAGRRARVARKFRGPRASPGSTDGGRRDGVGPGSGRSRLAQHGNRT